MARFYPSGGGGGADVDVVTAGAGDVLNGKIIVGADGEPLSGTMPNNGAVSSSLNCGESYTIPQGYHDGSGGVTANSLASQTSANATANKILNGYMAWVNGTKLTGNVSVTSAISFSAAALSTTSIRISWKNPSKGVYSGVQIRMSTSGYPGVSGGTLKYTGTGSSTTAGGTSYVDITGLSLATTYYFTCTSYGTGLGNGSSYNVSVKTKGLLLYDYGTRYYSVTNDTMYLNVTYESDHIYWAKKDGISNLANASPNLKFATGNVDLSSYSKCCIILGKTTSYYYSTSSGSYGYLSTVVTAYDSSGSPKSDYVDLGVRSTNGTTVVIALSNAKIYTYGYVLITVCAINPTRLTYGQIHKIWFE